MVNSPQQAAKLNISKVIFAGWAFCNLGSPAALGLTGLEAPFFSSSTSEEVLNLHISNPTPEARLSVSSHSLSELKNGRIDPATAVRATLKNGLVSPLFGIKSLVNSQLGSTGRQIDEFQFTFGGFPLCDFSLTTYTRTGSDPLILGRVPVFSPDMRSLTTSDFPAVPETVDRILMDLGQGGQTATVQGASRCLKSIDGQWAPVLKVTLTAGGLPYTAVADANKSYSLNGDFFSVAGTIDAFKKNALDGAVGSFTIDLVGDSHLTSAQLTTGTGPIARATAANNQFKYTASDSEFAEANAFVHVNSIYEWFKTLGYKWVGTTRLTIRVGEDIPTPTGSSTNNALYVPANYQPLTGAVIPGPVIAVGNGDGHILQDLPTDSDVVTHEFGHHVLFQKLKSTLLSEAKDRVLSNLNHSAVLHEGLADFFTFAYTGDACLGESICPDNTPACQVMTAKQHCLRSGATALNYGSDEYWKLGSAAHLKGQVVSGTMWDIRSRPAVSAKDFDKLAYASIDFLQQASTYSDWLIALMSADRDLFAGKYGCEIADAAVKRGFTEQAKELLAGCADFKVPPPADPSAPKGEETAVVSAGSAAGGTPVGASTKRSTAKKGACGTISLSASDPGYGTLMLFILLSLPVLTIGRSPVPIPARNKSSKPQ